MAVDKRRNALGKGLGALLQSAADIQNGIPTVAPKVVDTSVNHQNTGPAATNEVPISAITPNPYQPRLNFDEVAIEELAESIRNVGIIQPITLRIIGSGRYQIISGERRYRAAQLAGLTMVPAYIREADDLSMLEMAIVENIQRENLDPIETALSFQRLIDECNLTQEAMADRVGKKRATVTNFLRLLRLPAEVQAALKVDKISVGHAKALLSLPTEEDQLDLCKRAILGDWSVRTLEQKVKDYDRERPAKIKSDPIPQEFDAVKSIMGRYCDNNVVMKRSANGATSVTMKFKSDEQMELFMQAIDQL